MGEYFQVQDDYLDAYAPPEVLGKIGTDIQDNKCSWLVVQAMKHATAAQLATLKAHYGRHDADSVAVVKALYAELGLEAVFQSYEQVGGASVWQRAWQRRWRHQRP
jgi:farnesyl diphosphate synthase